MILMLQGLADESEFVRETALQAGQTIVNRYADTAVKLFLPQLERGLFDENWRIRYRNEMPLPLPPSLPPSSVSFLQTGAPVSSFLETCSTRSLD